MNSQIRAVPSSGFRIESRAASATRGYGEILMRVKAKVMLATLVVLLGTAFAMTAPIDGPDPICLPGRPCSAAK